ncbi:MAG: alpha-2-macroglobulin [Flavobacteriaceae bacterium]|nr:alpha-2-macroglobulin [Flavobacteriaceae bacterium]
MKHIFTLLMIVLFANLSQSQDNSYDDLWKSVEKFEMEGLPKSALKIVSQITSKADNEQNSQQQVKALLYKSKFALTLEEDAQLKIISDFKQKIVESEPPTSNFLENILAKLYWQYFQQHRWQFYDRSKTEEKVDVNDFRTWDLQTLFNEIHLHYQNSLKNGLILQQEDIRDYELLLHTVENSEIYRPTLFDFLAHNALEFYKTTENSITKPAYKFEVDDPSFLGDAISFSQMEISSKDVVSLQLNALKIYQDLINSHKSDDTKFALVAVDIERLNFVNEHATFSEKTELLINILQTEIDRHASHEISGLYAFELAKIYAEQGRQYQWLKNEEPRWKLKEAFELCEATIQKFPKGVATDKCEFLKKTLVQKSLQLTSEKFLPVQQQAKLLVNYKNINTLFFKVLQLSRKQKKELDELYRKEEQFAFLKKLSAVKNWQSELRDEGDFQNHSSEILLPALKSGYYVIMSSNTPDDEMTFSFATIQVTDYAIVDKSSPENFIYQIIDRSDGQPISNAKVILTYSFNNKRDGRDIVTTNANGEVHIKKKDDRYRRLDIEVQHKDQTAYFDGYYLSRYYGNNEEEPVQFRSFLFTDRSIYRPGQTVYFKGIAMQTKDGVSKVIPDELFHVELIDVNENEVGALKIKSNEFGSVAGEFILPNGGLTGLYYINLYADSGKIDVDSEHYFSVEEYKRPKFEAKFDPVSETYKIDDIVKVSGSALAYAGSNITKAKVVYRVHREVQYPRWYHWYHPWFNREPQEIKHGETTTDDQGNFVIEFPALADKSADKKNLPIFHYKISADVTDINGETRSTTTIVNVGYHAITATLKLESQLEKSKKDHRIAFETKNLNGELVNTSGTIKIYKLKAPSRVVRQRPWNAPDYQMFSENEFIRLFPNEAYAKEDELISWNKGDLIFEEKFDSETEKSLDLGNIKKWKSGHYIAVLETKDDFGQLVKDEIRTFVFGKADKTLPDNQLFSVSTDKSKFQEGDKVKLRIASAGNINVTVDVEKDQKVVNTYIIELDNNIKTLSIPVTENDLGGFVIHCTYAAYNSFDYELVQIAVPYPKKDLEIETLTFRDKLQPGADETWSWKIKGPNGDKVSAELLTSMYDASLDQFKPHHWTFDPFQNSVYSSLSHRNARSTFGNVNFRIYQEQRPNMPYTIQNYDRFNWFGFDFNNNRWVYQRYLRSLKAQKESSFNENITKGTIAGTVNDEQGLPLPGVNIIVKNTTTGVQSDFDGNFSIQATKGQTLVFSYVGYMTTEHVIDDNNYIVLNMFEDGEAMDEVVVTAQGIGRNKRSLELAAPLAMADEEDAMERSMGEISGVQLNETEQSEDSSVSFEGVQVRKNLEETAFFFPQLTTDKDGNVSFNFKTPESLTQWKLQLLAHTKSLESATATFETVTQKELMVIPNAPRFLREGDQIVIQSKIANISESDLSGQVVLQLFDALTGNEIDSKLGNDEHTQAFSVTARGNTNVSWSLSIPFDVQAVQYMIIAKAGDFSDGEQNALPVLSNRMLVTESMPMWLRSNDSKTFSLDKLKTNTSSTLKHHKLTLEMTSNPAWYAVQALPYLMEFPYDCNEQTFARFYANALATHIANSNPRIQEVFYQWRNSDALLSNLEKNQALKSLLIQETPWLRDAQSESEQKKRIALLFDLNKMNSELKSSLLKLKTNQMSNGAWPWFNGGRSNRYITQHIVAGFAHLEHLDNMQFDESITRELPNMLNKALSYLDSEFLKEYRDLRKYNKDVDLSKDHLTSSQLQYLYIRSFIPDSKVPKDVKEVIDYYREQIRTYWLKRGLYQKGLMALIMHRSNDVLTADRIIKSLRENSITSDELGMYWKENTSSWYWYQAPIETQALMIEAFSEIEDDVRTIDNLKIWLLKNKQTNSWKTTKATTEAVYALLLKGSNWLSVTDMVEVVIGNKPLDPNKLEAVKLEAGTGYFKTSWNGPEITSEMANVKLDKKGEGIAWGSLYWQYFEDLDKITSAETPLKLDKKLFLKRNTDLGEEISEITEDTELEVGDLIRVRIELRSDRPMEFVHMKDMRAAAMEPIHVLSEYKWQDNLGYYESTKDASTNFFFDYLPKGVFVFEYDLRVNNSGNFSNGITTIQSMYAPEFSSHSEGVRVKIN